jgi:hypothetical protein
LRGAAIASLCTFLISNIITYLLSRTIKYAYLDITSLWKIGLSVAIMVAVLIAVPERPAVLGLIVDVFIGIFIYAAGCFVLNTRGCCVQAVARLRRAVS